MIGSTHKCRVICTWMYARMRLDVERATWSYDFLICHNHSDTFLGQTEIDSLPAAHLLWRFFTKSLLSNLPHICLCCDCSHVCTYLGVCATVWATMNPSKSQQQHSSSLPQPPTSHRGYTQRSWGEGQRQEEKEWRRQILLEIKSRPAAVHKLF